MKSSWENRRVFPNQSIDFPTKGNGVFDGEVVKFSIINTKLEATIWHLTKKDGSSCWGFRGSDKTICQVGLNISFQSL